MPLFDAYVMMDWSGGNGRRAGKQDCIWIAHGLATGAAPGTVSPGSRSEAERIIRSLLQPFVGPTGGRVLVCADFAYGFPAGFASLLRGSHNGTLPAWRVVWQYLRKHLKDDLGTRPGGQPTNQSNRFEVANVINAAVSTSASPGPFWCLFKAGSYPCVPQKKPAQPFACTSGTIKPLRITDLRAKSNTPFRLFGTGSVGSQVLTGIPRLESLRFDPEFAPCSVVWPFETGWAPAAGSWLDLEVRVVHAEIYPSVRAPLPDTIKDRGQVCAMWQWARRLDADDRLIHELSIPAGIASGSPENVLILSEEGWILGCPR